MLRWAVKIGLRFRLLVLALAGAVLALGVSLLRGAQGDALPEFSPTYVEVQTEALGLSAAEVEQLITVPLEADLLNGVAFLQEIRSDSVPGLSSIVMIFEPGTDLYRARQVVSERLTQTAALPNVSKSPVMLEPVSSASRALVLGMSSDRLSLIEQSVLARWTLRPRLLGVPGVANVSVFGQRERQLQVQVDPARLRANDLALADVISTTGNATWSSPLSFLEASTPGTGGFIDTPNQRLAVQNVSPIVDAGSLGQVAVEGRPDLRLADVATVVEDHQLLIGDGIVGDDSGLMIVIEKFPEASTLEVTAGVEAALRALAPSLPGLRIDETVYRPASFVESAMSNIGLTLLLGGLLAVLLAGLFLRSWRTAVVALVSIPLAVATSIVVLHLFGVTVNLLVVLGLVGALLLVVDDAVRDGDAMARVRVDGGDGERPAAIAGAAVAMRRNALYASLILALAVLPVLVIPGSPGVFVGSIALAFLTGLASAMLVAVLVAPAVVSLLARRSGSHRDPPAVRGVLRGYDRLGSGGPRPRTALVAAGLALLVGIGTVPLLSVALMPTLQERDLLVGFDAAEGTSRPEMARITAAATAELRALPGVSQVGAHVGRAHQSDQVADVDVGEIWVRIGDTADYDATVAAVRAVVAGYPGLRREVQTYLGERSAGLLAAPKPELTVRLSGDDTAALDAKADEVRRLMAGVAGVRDAAVLRTPQRPTLQVEVDLARAQRYNVKPGDVRRTIATLLAGLEVGSVFERQKVYEVVVWGTPELRNSPTAVRDLLVDLPEGGGQVRIGDVASVDVVPAPAVIHRNAASRYVDVTATVAGRGLADVTDEVRQALRTVQLPFDHRAEIVGDPSASQNTALLVVGTLAVVLVLIFLLLQAALRSWWLAAVVLASLPVAVVGSAVATAIDGGTVSLGTLVGVLVVAGLALRLELSLLGELQEHRADGAEPGDLVVSVVRGRLGSIVASLAAVGVAVLPVVVTGSVAGLELLHPMAVAVLGGIVTVAALVVLVVPAVYAGRAWHNEEDLRIAPAEPALGPALVTSGDRN